MTLVLGEMNIARVSPYRSGQGEPPLLMAWSAPQMPAAANQFRGGGRHEVGPVEVLPGGRRPPGQDYIGRWGMGDDMRRAQIKRPDALWNEQAGVPSLAIAKGSEAANVRDSVIPEIRQNLILSRMSS